MPRKPNSPLEDRECQTFAEYLKLKGFLFTHISNETNTKNNWYLIKKYSRLGVNSGFPDYCIVLPDKGLAFVEMKRIRPKGRLSDAQKAWIEALNKIDNVECTVAFGATEAINFIEQFL